MKIENYFDTTKIVTITLQDKQEIEHYVWLPERKQEKFWFIEKVSHKPEGFYYNGNYEDNNIFVRGGAIEKGILNELIIENKKCYHKPKLRITLVNNKTIVHSYNTFEEARINFEKITIKALMKY